MAARSAIGARATTWVVVRSQMWMWDRKDVHSDDQKIELSLTDLRAVAGFAAMCAQKALTLFERSHPEDPRPRSAVDAAKTFANGERRSNVQRSTAVAAHRASKEATDPVVQHAARAAGDAAASVYLHPLAQASQVGHILGSASNAARAFELDAGGDTSIGSQWLATFQGYATSDLRNVLARYPEVPSGTNRLNELMRDLDRTLRLIS